MGALAALTTTLLNPHRGAALPAARVVVVMIPLVLLSIFLWLRRRP